MPSVANVTGTDLSVYKVVEKNQFALQDHVILSRSNILKTNENNYSYRVSKSQLKKIVLKL